MKGISLVLLGLMFSAIIPIANADANLKIEEIEFCNTFYDEFQNLGESKFKERYIHHKDQTYCAILFSHPAWSSDISDREKILSEIIANLKGEKITKEVRDRPESDKTRAPQWIKDDAKMWYEGKQTDSKFAFSLRYLVESKFVIPPPEQEIKTIEMKIPSWFKNTTEWWSVGMISDTEYFTAMEYLMGKNILRL